MKIRRLIYIAALPLLAVSCTDGYEALEAPETPQSPESSVIVNSPEGALAGSLMVKFLPETDGQLNQAQSRMGAANIYRTASRSGITEVDRALQTIGADHIERIFPVNKTEDKTREAGLHRWYVIRFSEGTDVRRAAEELAKSGKVAKIQYCHALKRPVGERPARMALASSRTVGVTPQAGFFNDPDLNRQWHYINTGDQTLVPGSVAGADVNCAEAWKRCTGDPSVIVAVMDEGVMYSHPDLAANMWKNEGETFKSPVDNDGNGYAGDVYGYNFAENSPAIAWTGDKDTGHGTHVAGTIAAVNNNNEGVCGIAGGSGNGDGVRIMSIQIFSGDFGANPYNEARGIKYAADNGAVILQCSWGYMSSLSDAATSMRGYANDEQWIKACPVEKEALDYFVHNAGSPNGVMDGGLVIFASGNEYAAAAGYPGAYGDYVSVVAMDAAYMPSSYTNYGKFVDIMAPGGDSDYHKGNAGSILSTLPPGKSGGTGYGYMDGTSMACPHVSGVAALGLSYAAKLHKHFTAARYKELLLQAVRNVEDQWPESKLYYKYFASGAGESTPVRMELNKYFKGQTGTGLVDANKMLDLVEQNGVELNLPNLYVATGTENKQKVDLFRFFPKGEGMTFTVEVADGQVASVVSEDGKTVVVTGLKVGSTTYTVTASDGQKQTAEITVRRKANGNGWL